MIKHSSKVKVDDLQGIILVSSVVASATDERSELSEESKVGWKQSFYKIQSQQAAHKKTH